MLLARRQARDFVTEDAQGTPTQSHISPSILLYEDKPSERLARASAGAGLRDASASERPRTEIWSRPRPITLVSHSHYQSTLDAVYVYVVPWSEFPIVPSYPHYPHGACLSLSLSHTDPHKDTHAYTHTHTHTHRHILCTLGRARLRRRKVVFVHPYRACPRQISLVIDSGLVGSGRGTARAEDAQETPTQSHISPSSILVNEGYWPPAHVARLRL